jgi:hypothetical protein
MTAPIKVIAVGHYAVADLLHSGGAASADHVLVLCEMPRDTAKITSVGTEHALCALGFSSEVLARAEDCERSLERIKHAAGVQQRRAIRLAQSLADIGRAYKDAEADIVVTLLAHADDAMTRAVQGCGVMGNALNNIGEIVDSCRPDMEGAEPSKAARDVLAAAGWTDIGDGVWACSGRNMTACIQGGTIDMSGAHEYAPAILRAFAAVAEETAP